jgi:hypothetical protein
VSGRIFAGTVPSSVAQVVEAGLELLPHFDLAAIPLLEGAERPAEWPAIRRRLRAEGIRSDSHRGVILLPPGELDHFASVGLFAGNDELFLCTEWTDEFEPFPARITTDTLRFEEGTPLGLEEWMIDASCLLALGDGDALNFAALDPDLAARIRRRFPSAKRGR